MSAAFKFARTDCFCYCGGIDNMQAAGVSLRRIKWSRSGRHPIVPRKAYPVRCLVDLDAARLDSLRAVIEVLVLCVYYTLFMRNTAFLFLANVLGSKATLALAHKTNRIYLRLPCAHRPASVCVYRVHPGSTWRICLRLPSAVSLLSDVCVYRVHPGSTWRGEETHMQGRA